MGALPYKISRIFNRWEPYHIKQVGSLIGGSPTTQNKVKPCLYTAFNIRDLSKIKNIIYPLDKSNKIGYNNSGDKRSLIVWKPSGFCKK